DIREAYVKSRTRSSIRLTRITRTNTFRASHISTAIARQPRASRVFIGGSPVPADSRPPSSEAASSPRSARLSVPRVGEWLRVGNFPARSMARWRRWLGRSLLVLPFLLVLGHDLSLRADRLVAYDTESALFFAFSLFLSAAFWAGLLAIAVRRHGLLRFA